MTLSEGARKGILWDVVAVALLALTAYVVLAAAPVFPTQDGPVHLYYVDVLRDLLKHSGPYAHDFEIKRFLTPYALEYYSLLGLETVFSPAMSEKILICVYIFAFGLGFRYLLTSVSGRNNPWAIAGIPFCMNVVVYLGFLNYCLSVAAVLFLCGLWIRHWRELRPRDLVALLACFVLALLTHAVPVAVFLVFAAILCAVDILRAAEADPGGPGVPAKTRWTRALRERWLPVTTLFVGGAGALVWVSLFANHAPPPWSPDTEIIHQNWIVRGINTLKLWQTTPFTSAIYRCVLALPLILAVWAGAVNARKLKKSTPAIALLAASLICFVLVCVAPRTMNGSNFFPIRFVIFWTVFLLAAVAALAPSRRWAFAMGITATLVTLALLPVQWTKTAQIARELAPVLKSPPASEGSVGLIIGEKQTRPAGLNFNPLLWSGVHYFRRSEAILANAPWTDLPHIMIRPVHANRWNYLDPYPAGVYLQNSLGAAGAVSDLDLIVVDGPSGAATQKVASQLRWNRPLPGAQAATILRRP